MDVVRLRTDGLVALLAAAAAIGGSYAVAGWTERFVPVPIDQTVIDATPAPIVSWAILALGESGHLLHRSLSLALALAVFGLCGVLGRSVGRRWRVGPGLAIGAVLVGVVSYAIAGSVGSAVAAALPFAAVLGIASISVDQAPPSRTRRSVLGLGGVVLASLGVSYAVGRLAGTTDSTEPLPDERSHESLLSEAEASELDVDGLEGLVTPIGEFYTVDIASSAPRLDASEWELRITGEVENEVAIDYDDLLDRESERRFVTLRCVSDSRNGDTIGNALWTGVPIADLVERAGPRGGCECAMLRAADGYYERFPVEALERTFLAYGMNGRTLPRSHGRPVRALVPGHWGEINVKWLTEIEILDEEVEGYWEERGWHGTGPVKTVAKLRTVNRLEDGRIEVAGHAYAGTRGVGGVEVSVDGGEEWTDATLSDLLPGDDVWRQWRHRYDPSGEQEVVVRAIESDGTVQSDEETDPFPDGPSGWVRRTIEP